VRRHSWCDLVRLRIAHAIRGFCHRLAIYVGRRAHSGDAAHSVGGFCERLAINVAMPRPIV
jgi:hypothetical protein